MTLPVPTNTMAAETAPQSERRRDLVRRLVDRGVPTRTLEALLPGWEVEIAAVLDI